MIYAPSRRFETVNLMNSENTPAKSGPGMLFNIGVIAMLILTLGVFAFYITLKRKAAQQPQITNYRMIADFNLIDQNGEPFTRADLEGKVWVANFIFTSCAKECPILTFRMAEIQKKYLDNPDFAMVSISIDPRTDTPERLTEFANRYGAQKGWAFLTGDNVREIDALVKGSFLLPLARTDKEKAKIVTANLLHSEKLVVVDKLGVVRFYAEGMPPEAVGQITTVVDQLLAEPGS